MYLQAAVPAPLRGRARGPARQTAGCAGTGGCARPGPGATFTLLALLNAGYQDEARAWREWLVRAAAGRPEQIHIMYGIAGERRLPEHELPWNPRTSEEKAPAFPCTTAGGRRYSDPVPLHLVEHPVVHDALATLRDASTPPETFRRLAVRISLLLAAEATRDVPAEWVAVETPLGSADGKRVSAGVVVVPVLRAGLGMLDAVLELLPNARVGHIGLQRDELTAVASQYYAKLPPDMTGSYVLMIDPMLATGGSAVAALDLLHAAGARGVRMICIVAAPEGIALVERHHPDVHIYTPVVDRGLNAHKFIVPGLGDFGDRLYGTT